MAMTEQDRLCRDPTLPDPSWSRFSERAKFLPVSFILSIIVILYFIYTFQHCVPLIKDDLVWGCIETAIFNLLTVMLVTCYFKSMLQHPGTVPDEEISGVSTWEHRPMDLKAAAATEEVQMKEKKMSGEKRTCKWCNKVKPDRAHHCRVCRMCILKMDHHCPWIYNCVGYKNQKFFFLLVLYAVLCLHFIVWTMFPTVWDAAINEHVAFTDLYCILVGESIAALFALVFTVFLFFHSYLVIENMTTIEFCEKNSKPNSFRQNLRPFDQGTFGNLKACLGDNVALWFLPCSPPSGDGLSFKTEMTPLKAKNKDRGPKSPKQQFRDRCSDEATDGMDVAKCALAQRSRNTNAPCSPEGDACEDKSAQFVG